jgi:hypothetical protein
VKTQDTHTSGAGLRLQRRCPQGGNDGESPSSPAPAKRELGLSPGALSGKVERKVPSDAFKKGSGARSRRRRRGRPRSPEGFLLELHHTRHQCSIRTQPEACRLLPPKAGALTPHAAPDQPPAYRDEDTAAPHAAVGTQNTTLTSPPRRLSMKTCNPPLPEPPCSRRAATGGCSLGALERHKPPAVPGLAARGGQPGTWRPLRAARHPEAAAHPQNWSKAPPPITTRARQAQIGP